VKRGFSIIETVLVMSILSTLLMLVAFFFVRARHFTSDAETYSRVQRQANLSLRRITDDLTSASKTWHQYFGTSVVFLSTEPNNATDPRLEFDSATGKVLWKKWVCYYYDASQRSIIRSEIPLQTPVSDLTTKPLPNVDLVDFESAPAQKRRQIARDVKLFDVTGTGDSFIISVTCEATSPVPGRQQSDKMVEVTVTTEVNLLN
jgi:prepilin-type N-terminal cleavage/methylation domain-containing protein